MCGHGLFLILGGTRVDDLYQGLGRLPGNYRIRSFSHIGIQCLLTSVNWMGCMAYADCTERLGCGIGLFGFQRI